MDEFGEVAGRILQSLHDNALDLAALVGKRHDELVGFDRHHTRDDGGLGRGRRIASGVGHGDSGISGFDGGRTENGRFLDLRSVHREHQFGSGGVLGPFDLLGSLLGLGRGLSLGLRLGLRGIRGHPPDDNHSHQDGTDNSILVHFFSFLGGTGS